ncbi:hypothetical protein Tco_0037717 [Tanacetum coccineum]
MSNSNTNLQTQSSNALHNVIMEMMNELVKNQCHVTNHQVNVQFLLQLQPERQRFVTLVKQSQELKTVSYHKLYDILKQHQNEVNEIRAERLVQPDTVTKDDEISKDKEINKLMVLISLSFKKIYKPTNNNLQTSSNTSRAYQDNSPRINRGTRYDNQRAVNVARARENVGTPVVQMSRIQCYNCKEYGHNKLIRRMILMMSLKIRNWKHIIFDDEPMHKVQNNNDNYNVFAMENEHPKQPESNNDIYLVEHGDSNITNDSLDICYDRIQDD